ncbi:MAG: tetrathionate reductase family octaheme c-type cytochrome, partial [Phaeovulum sp.]
MAHRAWALAAFALAPILWGGAVAAQAEVAAAGVPAAALVGSSTADHSKFEVLKKPFASGPEVTQACLSCHTEASDQVMHTVHWQWDYTQPETGQLLGKSEVLNSFCGNVAGNEARCTSCHIGYGWTDVREEASSDPTQVDCLACHDTSGQYAKQDNQAGKPPLDPVAPGAKTITGAVAWAVNLSEAAQSVGAPGRDNCGNCHFYGGGGDNVKHGDLSSVLYAPSRDVDVHMSSEGADMTCVDCHVTEGHAIDGSRFATNVTDPHAADRLPGAASDVAACDSCHTNAPHPATVVGLKLNDHTDRVACESCHIPSFARGGIATKTLWDWSTAGRLTEDGKVISEHGYTQGNGTELHSYISTKGNFEWAENVVPHYAWFDGNVTFTLRDTVIDPTSRVEINQLHGDAADQDSRIFPFK